MHASGLLLYDFATQRKKHCVRLIAVRRRGAQLERQRRFDLPWGSVRHILSTLRVAIGRSRLRGIGYLAPFERLARMTSEEPPIILLVLPLIPRLYWYERC